MKRYWKRALMAMLAAAALCLTAAAAQLPQEERYGFATLQKEGQTALLQAYQQLEEGLSRYESDIRLGSRNLPITADDLQEVVEIYLRDHPEVFWLGDTYSYSVPVNGVSLFMPRYSMTEEEIAAAQADMEAVAAQLLHGVREDMSEFEKELRIHEALAAHVCYDLSAPNRHTAYGALVEGRSVCDGYTEAFQYLLHQVGIQTYKVSGYSRNQSHAWNLVRIDGEYYYADVTWDDQGDDIYHAYFNITGERLAEDHTIDVQRNTLPLPACESDEANYFTVFGGKLSELTVETVAELFRSSNDGVARLYADMDQYQSVVEQWYSENIWEIVGELEFYGSFYYGYRNLGREYHLYIDGYVPPEKEEVPHIHTETVIPAVEAACLVGGTTEGLRCMTCGEILAQPQILPALGHEEAVLPGQLPTCTEEGCTEGIACRRCGEILAEQTAIPALGHQEEIVPGEFPTCTEDGLTDSAICGRCGAVLTAAEVIPASGHVYENGVCGICGEADPDSEMPADKTAVVTAAVPAGAVMYAGGKSAAAENGVVTLELPVGIYDVTVKMSGCLSYTVKNVALECNVDLGNIPQVRGDTNGDDMINIMDMAAFRQNFGKMGAAVLNPHTDTNGDGMVNIMDMGTFRMNFGKTAAKDCTVVFVG